MPSALSGSCFHAAAAQQTASALEETGFRRAVRRAPLRAPCPEDAAHKMLPEQQLISDCLLLVPRLRLLSALHHLRSAFVYNVNEGGSSIQKGLGSIPTRLIDD
mmetsp:Transcript_65187/g.95475  ORF Transcript_65187/g.95475 Transcript_65187/m.95475 type:complete len:104 (-) Transcript_65187:43-354(-)